MADKNAALSPDDHRHGTANGYQNLGCRCEECRIAWALYYYEREYWRARVTSGALRKKYRQARDAGFSSDEARRRMHWSDPLAR